MTRDVNGWCCDGKGEHAPDCRYSNTNCDDDAVKNRGRAPAEAPAPSQTEAAEHDLGCNIFGCKGCSCWCHNPQAAQTVASPTAEEIALRHFPRGVEHHDQMCLSRCEDAIEEYREMTADYAATLEARLAAQKNIIATLGEGKAAAEERAEKAEARVGELERQLATREKCSMPVMRDCPTHGESPKLRALAVSLRDVGETLSGKTWVYDGVGFPERCFACEGTKDNGHWPDCWLSALLSRLSTGDSK